MIKKLVVCALVVAVAVAAAIFLTTTRSSGPDLAACKSAMKSQFVYGMDHPDAPAGKRPSACKGVSDSDLQKFASEIMSDYLGSNP